MAAEKGSKQLLMIANFVHEGTEELRVDMVRFSSAIMLKEIRIVPKGYQPHSSMKSIELFGKTSPDNFKLDAYCNDATNPLAPTFIPLGSIKLNEGTLCLSIDQENPCDIVVLRGPYTGLSVCLYGTQAPPPSSRDALPVQGFGSQASGHSPSPFSDNHSEDPYHKRPGSPSDGTEKSSKRSRDDKVGVSKDWSSLLDSYNTLFDPLSPDHSPEHSFDMYDDDIPTSKRSAATAGAGFEEFSDEEIAFGEEDEFEMQEQEQGIDFEFEDTWMSTNFEFNPYQTEISKLETFPSLFETPHEAILHKKPKHGGKKSRFDEGTRLRDLLNKQKSSSITQKWVESVEDLAQQLYPGLAQLINRSEQDGYDALTTLCGWVSECIKETTMLTQPPPLNIRVLKLGLRLTQSLTSLGHEAVQELMSYGVLSRLCEIVCQPSSEMPSSIKLQVLKALLAMLDYPSVLEKFLNWNSTSTSDKGSLYCRMLEVVLTNQTSRVQSSISCLLQKAHVFEVLANLQKSVEQVIELTSSRDPAYWNIRDGTIPSGGDQDEVTPSLDRDSGRELRKREEESLEEVMEVEPCLKKDIPSLPVELVNRITELLRDLVRCFDRIESISLLPVKAFPSISPPDQTCQEVFVGVARMCKDRRLLESLLVLLTAPSLLDMPAIFEGVRDLLLNLLSTQNGLLLLFSNPTVSNTMIRSLIQSDDSDQLPLDALQPLSAFQQDSSKESCNAVNLGMLLIHHLQVLQLLDSIRLAPKQTMNDIESDCLPILHNIFSMTLVPIGKYAVSHVLSLDNNLTYILPFMEPRSQKDYDNKLSRSCISSRYAAVLVLQLLRCNVILSNDCLTPNVRRLLNIAEFFQENQSSTMSAMYSWLHPLKHIGDIPSTMSSLIGVIKEGVAQLSWNKPNRGSAAIITSLQMILVRCSSAPQSSGYKEGKVDRHQREAIVALFSSSGIDVMTTLLKKLSDALLPLWSQKQIIGVSNASVIELLSSLSLKLLRLLLCELMNDGVFQLRDTRVMQALFSLHTVMCSAPKSGVFQAAAPEIQSLIIDCLVTYTKPRDVNAKEPISPDNSCWCLLLNELLTYTQATPHSFLSGLMLLTELLPLPLPVNSPKNHSDTEIQAIVQYRHLWVCHLLPLSSSLSSLFDMVISSQSISLQQILRRVLAQLLDLAPSLAIMVAQKVACKILAQIDSEDESGKDGDTSLVSAEKKETGSLLVSMLTLCAVLSGQPMFKMALLSLITSKGSAKEEEEEGGGGDGGETLQRIIPLLLFLVQKKETGVPAKLCTMTILQSVVNANITLREPVDKGDQSVQSVQELADCLPPMTQLENIISAVLNYLGSPDQPLSTIAIGLKILLIVIQNMAGRTLLMTLLPSSTKRFTVLLKRLISSIKEQTRPSPETLQCLSLFLDTLSGLTMEEKGFTAFPVPLIKCLVTEEEGDNGGDLLLALLNTIQDSYKEHQSLVKGFMASITVLTELFSGHSAVPSLGGMAPPTLELPPMRSLEDQFISRVSVVQTPVEDSSSPEYWLTTPPYDETELEPERVTTDLSALATEVKPSLDLQEELKKQLLPSPPSSPKERKKRKIVFSGPEAQKRLREAIQQRKAMGRGRDLFRTRKQNTSRPPSMHVDDFMNIGHRVPGGIQRGGSIPRGLPRGGMTRGREHMGMGGSYMMPPPPMYPPHLGGRFLGGGLSSHYPRRDLPGLPFGAPAAQSWERRAQHFLASMHKPDPLGGRPLWSLIPQDPYRARNARMVEIMSSYGPRPLPSPHISSRLSSSSRRT